MEKILGKEEFEVLAEVRNQIADSAVIAGGAPRDLFFGKPYRDVDIFLPANNKILQKYGQGYLIDELLPIMFNSEITLSDFSDGLNKRGKMVPAHIDDWGEPQFKFAAKPKIPEFQVMNATYNGTKYQLIFVPNMKSLFQTFDFNCNMISHDGKNVKMGNFFKAFKDMTPPILENYKKENSAMLTRVEQLIHKYPEWKISESVRKYKLEYYAKLENSDKKLSASQIFGWQYVENN